MSRRLSTPPTRVIAEMRRPATGGETIRVSLLGQRPSHCDLRVFSPTRSSQGEPRPTNAGICIRLDQLGDVIAALQAAEKERGR